MSENKTKEKLRIQKGLLDECFILYRLLEDRFNVLFMNVDYNDKELERLVCKIKREELKELKCKINKIKSLLDDRTD